eukprot:1511553-Pyramimonas_sp.AAC.1
MSLERRTLSQARVPNWGRMDPAKQREVEEQGIRHLLLCARVAELQVQHGRFFALEQPVAASSWDLETIRRVSDLPRVSKLAFDQ